MGVGSLAASVNGQLLRRAGPWGRGVLFIVAVMMIVPEKMTDFLGVIGFVLLLIVQSRQRRAIVPGEAKTG
ncbi:MAG: hypothetical protein ACE5JS_09780 [Nitrospinota bacterium]